MREARCETRAPDFGDKRDITCQFTAAGVQQALFKVRFLGSHDDTQLSMTPALDGLPLTCGPGSKTSSRFEDGEITLECRFVIEAKVDSTHLLKMEIVWTHAQYDGFEFTLR